MSFHEANSDSTNLALARGVADFAAVLDRLAPRPSRSSGNARMRPVNAARMRDDAEHSDEDQGDSDDPWETGDDPDAAADDDQMEDDPDEDGDQDDDHVPPSLVPPAHGFNPAAGGPLVAVDAGMIRLAETAGGLVIAIRAAVVVDNSTGAGEKSEVYLLRSGPLFLPWPSQLKVLHAVGAALGEPGLYVTLDKTDPACPVPTEVKRGSERPGLYAHRIMVLWERLAQRMAVSLAPQDATLALDGSLTLRSRDTPQAFLKGMARDADAKGISIVGLSKRSDLLIGASPQTAKRPSFWLDDQPRKSCYRCLSPLLDAAGGVGPAPSKNAKPRKPMRADRILGRCYAVRLSPLAATYRMDVQSARGVTDAEALDQFYASALVTSGYPSVLAQAHSLCYFSAPDVLALQMQAAREFGLTPHLELGSTGAFAPFQGSFK